jgi:hypothetical protein
MNQTARVTAAILVAGGLAVASMRTAGAQPGDGAAPRPHAHAAGAASSRTLPPLPTDLPRWMKNRQLNHIFYKRGRYNFDVYNIKPLAYDLNAVAVGHAMAYEDLVTGKASTLETKTFDRINRVLNHPPKLMPDERAISPTFGRVYGGLEQVFDWTHVLHAQTVDVLASTDLTQAAKDREIEALWKFYFESVPYAITPLPMNMEYLDSQPYSGAFRKKYPKVNGLFWGYHWLQGSMYDLLDRASLPAQRAAYAVLGEQYHKVELYRTDRPFMPMFAGVSPEFAARFPHIANAFDNLHMLHDLVNDILATDWMTEKQKGEQITRAVWMVMASTHAGEKPGDSSSERLHDHRFTRGMPGMGMMKGSTEEVMFMPGMGWMRMDDCAHCSMPLAAGEDAWRAATVSAEGWSMRVRCALCARDMSAQVKGRSVLRLPTEDPMQKLVLISDEEGNLTTEMKGVVFLEDEGAEGTGGRALDGARGAEGTPPRALAAVGFTPPARGPRTVQRPPRIGHPRCHEWSRAFTSRAAFDAYVKANPEYAKAKPLSLAEWAERNGGEPDTYVKPRGPVENPYGERTAREKPDTD